jgi:Flp pilus assembly protein TadG
MIKRKPQSGSRRRRGAALVEFAVVAPLMLMLTFALFEFGRMVMVHQALCNGAREGCRKAVLSTTIDEADADAAVRAFLDDTISVAADPAKLRVTFDPADITAATASRTPVTVTVSVDFSDVTWVPSFLSWLTDLEIQAAARMERE